MSAIGKNAHYGSGILLQFPDVNICYCFLKYFEYNEYWQAIVNFTF